VPNSTRVNRGGYVLKDLVKIGNANNFSDVVIVHETRGEPDGLIVCHLPYGPTTYFGLANVVLRHDLKDKVDPVSEAYPHLIFDGFNSKIGDRIVSVLKHMFPMPKIDTKRLMTFANRDDFISFRHHVYRKTDYKEVQTKELGPRFELKPYQICLGTVD
jgi:U3 small nucleolar ribonucleoprotein protein IMP4